MGLGSRRATGVSAVSSLVVRSTGMKVLVSGWQIVAQVERARITGGTLVLLQKSWGFDSSAPRRGKRPTPRKPEIVETSVVEMPWLISSPNAVDTQRSTCDRLYVNMKRTVHDSQWRKWAFARLDITLICHEDFCLLAQILNCRQRFSSSIPIAHCEILQIPDGAIWRWPVTVELEYKDDARRASVLQTLTDRVWCQACENKVPEIAAQINSPLNS